MRGGIKIAIVLALVGLIAAVTPVLASGSGSQSKAMAGYTGKVQNRVLADTAAGGESSFIIELAQQADLSRAYGMKDQNARGWFVYRTLKETAAKTQAPIKAALDAQGVSYRSFWVANEIVVHSGGKVAPMRRGQRLTGQRLEIHHIDSIFGAGRGGFLAPTWFAP